MTGLQASLTDRLILEPIGVVHADELWVMHQDAVIATWYGGAWSEADAYAFCERCAWGWKHLGVCKWIAHDRDTGALVGRGGLSRLPPESDQTRSIAALIGDPMWERDRL